MKDIYGNYKELANKSLFTHRALMIWWCNIDAISYYNNIKLEKIKMSKQVYEQNFKGKNWNEINKEQFIFIGDTMYFCIY